MAIPLIAILAKTATILTSLKAIVGLFKKEEVKEMKNWRTTLVGAMGAAIACAVDLFMKGSIEPITAALSIAMAFLGYMAKDAGVSGAEK